MATRRQVREAVVSILYSEDVGNEKGCSYANVIFEEKKIRNKQLEYGQLLLNGTVENLGKINATIEAALQDWELDRVGSIERAILRLGVYEIFFEKVDKAIVINEAVELAKLFGAENSAKFVNGVLDALKELSEAKPALAKQVVQKSEQVATKEKQKSEEPPADKSEQAAPKRVDAKKAIKQIYVKKLTKKG